MKYVVRRHILSGPADVAEMEIPIPPDVGNPNISVLAVGPMVQVVTVWLELTPEEKSEAKAQQARQALGLQS